MSIRDQFINFASMSDTQMQDLDQCVAHYLQAYEDNDLNGAAGFKSIFEEMIGGPIDVEIYEVFERLQNYSYQDLYDEYTNLEQMAEYEKGILPKEMALMSSLLRLTMQYQEGDFEYGIMVGYIDIEAG